MEQRYNTRSPAVKRLMREAQELSEPTDQYYAQPLEDNLFEWHFTVRGPADTDFQGGIYHGRIILPVDYPMKPPSIIWLTPNGRFETNKKICLSISGHHPESWQPSWSIRTALLAIIGFMPTHPGGAIGSLDYKPEERKVLAKRSRDWKCPACGDITQILLEVPSEPSQADTKASQEAKELASQIAFQGEKPSCKETECPIEKAAATTSASSTSSAATDNQGVSNNSSVNAATSGPQSFPQANMSPQLPGFPPPCSGIARPVPDPGTFYHPFTQPFLPNPCWMPNMPTNYQSESGVAAMIPRFPYPPSHYPGGYSVPFYPTGLAPPPGVGMFPSPFLPPISPQGSPASGCQAMPLMTQNMPTPISVNNSSATYQSDGQTLAPNSASPSMSPIPHNPPTSPASSGVAENSMPNTPAPSPVRSSVLSELLAKVKRIGSDDNVEQGSSVDQASPATVNLSAAAQSTHVINKDVPTTELSSYSSEESAQSTTEAQATSASVQNKRSLDKSPYVVPEARKTTSVGPVKSSSIEEMAAASQVEKITGADKQEDSFTRGELQAGRVSQVSEEKGELHLLSMVSERRESERSSVSEQKKDVNIQEVVAQENVQVFLTSQIVTSVSNIPKETDVGDSSLVEEFAHTRPDSMPGVTDSEVSLSLKKQESPNDITGTEASHSELPADGEENSEAAAPPIEMSEGDEKSSIEKTASSSMSDLEKMRKLGNTKPLRQRQSATARIPQDVNEEEISDASPPVSGQRIEAASGDTTLRNPRLLRQGVRALNEARQIHREALAQVRQRQSPYYDISFLLMVGLCLATVFILLNRVFNTFDWTNISFSEFYQ